MRRTLLLAVAVVFMIAAVAQATPGPTMDCQGHNVGEIHDAFIRNGYDCNEVRDTSVIGDSYNHYTKRVFNGCGIGRQKVYTSNIKLVRDTTGIHGFVFGSTIDCFP